MDLASKPAQEVGFIPLFNKSARGQSCTVHVHELATRRRLMRRIARLGVLALACLAWGQTAAFAQAIAGVVRDASGGVMPGVTVEASSPVLIEKTRTVVTDGDGQYKIINLNPGTYAVTFTLAGFNTVKREGIELTGDFTAPVNAEMKVGAIEETITVSGQ